MIAASIPEPNMDFKNRFLEALRAGNDDKALLNMARESATNSIGLQNIYEVVQSIWQDSGFDERSDGGKLLDSLEYVMERIWYEIPTTEGIH